MKLRRDRDAVVDHHDARHVDAEEARTVRGTRLVHRDHRRVAHAAPRQRTVEMVPKAPIVARECGVDAVQGGDHFARAGHASVEGQHVAEQERRVAMDRQAVHATLVDQAPCRLAHSRRDAEAHAQPLGRGGEARDDLQRAFDSRPLELP